MFFSVRGEGKCEIDYKKKENFFFSFRKLFNYFWWLVCRKRWLESVSGLRRRSREQKKVILKKRGKARFLDIMGRKNGVCVGRWCVRVITAEKKVICKKWNLSALSGILGHFKSEFRKKKVNGIFSDYEER